MDSRGLELNHRDCSCISDRISSRYVCYSLLPLVTSEPQIASDFNSSLRAVSIALWIMVLHHLVALEFLWSIHRSNYFSIHASCRISPTFHSISILNIRQHQYECWFTKCKLGKSSIASSIVWKYFLDIHVCPKFMDNTFVPGLSRCEDPKF